MHEIVLRFVEREDAEKLNNIICSFFAGNELFIKNCIVVSPVHAQDIDGKTYYFFSVSFWDSKEETTITYLEAGTLSLFEGCDDIWSFVKDVLHE